MKKGLLSVLVILTMIVSLFTVMAVNASAEKISITVTSGSGEWTYDGTEHYVYDAQVTSGALKTGDTLTCDFKTSSKITDAGTAVNDFDVIILRNNTDDVTSEYSIRQECGTLKVNKRSVVLTSASDSKKYDGTPLTNNEITVSGDGFAAGQGATYTVFGTVTKYGSAKNRFDFTLNSGTKDGNYSIEQEEGTLEVVQADAITITANSNSKMYDGTVLTDNGYTVSGALPVGHYVTGVVVSGRIKDGGTIANKVTGYKIFNGSGENVTSCFAKANYIDGTLTITPRYIAIESGSAAKIYDGTPLTNNSTPVVIGGDGFVGTQGYTADVTGSRTLVGKSKNTYTITLNPGTKSQNYNIVTLEGDLTVEAKSDATIDIQILNQTKMYDGTTSIDTSSRAYDAFGKGLAEGEHLEVSLYTEQVNVGKGKILATYKVLNAAGEDVTAFYNKATISVGYVTVNYRNTVKIKVDDMTKVYDGTDSVAGATYTVEGVLPEETAEIVLSTTQIKPGEGLINADVRIFRGTEDVTSNYSGISMNLGKLTVTKREVILTSGDASKVYDGKPLTNDEIDVWGDGFLDGEGATYKVTGTRTASGSSKNTFTYTLNKGTDAENYDITIEEGTLTVFATQAINDTIDITADNVKLSDEALLKQAEKDYQALLKADITADEKAEFQKGLERVQKALKAIENAKNVTALNTALGGLDALTVENEKQVRDLEAAFNALTANEKTMLDAAVIANITRASVKMDALHKEAYFPEMIEGAKQIVDLKDRNAAIFRSQAPFGQFSKVLVDGKEVASDKYVVTEGSTIVTLDSAFLKTLKNGEHTISIVSTYGEAESTFTVKNANYWLVFFIILGVAVVVVAGGVVAAIVIIRKKREAGFGNGSGYRANA